MPSTQNRFPWPQLLSAVLLAMGGGVAAAQTSEFQSCVKPNYPVEARQFEAQGATLVSFLIDTDGHVLESRIDRSAGDTREHKLLDQAAIQALSKCRFRPANVDGRPERSWIRVEYRWKLVD